MFWKVFGGVLAALVVFTVLIVLFLAAGAHEAARQRQEAWQSVLRAAKDPDPMGFRAAAAARQRAMQRQRQLDARSAADLAERRRRALLLADDERCIGGTVVRVSGNVYTQVAGAGARPVACAGRSRLR